MRFELKLPKKKKKKMFIDSTENVLIICLGRYRINRFQIIFIDFDRNAANEILM